MPPSEKRENSTFTVPYTTLSIKDEIILYTKPILMKNNALLIVYLFLYKTPEIKINKGIWKEYMNRKILS